MNDLMTDFTDTNAVTVSKYDNVGGIWISWRSPFGYVIIKYLGE